MYPNKDQTVKDMYLKGLIKSGDLQGLFDEIVEKFHLGSEPRQPTEVMGFSQDDFTEYINGRAIDEIFDSGVKSLASSK